MSWHRWKKLDASIGQVETDEDMRANHRFTRETWFNHSSFTKTIRIPQIPHNSIIHLGKTATAHLNYWGTRNFRIEKKPTVFWVDWQTIVQTSASRRIFYDSIKRSSFFWYHSFHSKFYNFLTSENDRSNANRFSFRQPRGFWTRQKTVKVPWSVAPHVGQTDHL